MGTQILYLISGIITGVCFIIFLFVFIKKQRINRLQKQLLSLERQKNLIVGTPIMSELSKIEVIVKNEKLEEKLKEWSDRYENIKTTRFSAITDMILGADALIDEKQIKEAKEAILNIEMEIYKLRVTTDNLLDEIREITMSEERNRAIVTKLKARFRDLEKTVTTNPKAYGEIYKNIELQLENIEKKFQDFEEIMENNEYSEVIAIVKVLDEMIAHIGVVVDEAPDLILLTDKIVPSRIKEATELYEKLVSKSYPLAYLKFDYNIEQIEKKTKEIVDRLKILNLEDSMFELKTFLDYLDNLINDLEIEKRSKRIFDEIAKDFKEKIIKINEVLTSIYEQLDDIKNMYNLSNDDLTDLEKVKNNLYELNSAYNNIIKTIKEQTEPYSKLKNDIEVLSSRLQNIESELELCLKSLGSMHDDEVRAREQLDEISEVLKKCRLKIRSFTLPIISNNYFVELSEANEAIYEIIKELEKTPITIKTLNIRVDTARDLSLKLYNTTNEMIKTAKLAEMIIEDD